MSKTLSNVKLLIINVFILNIYRTKKCMKYLNYEIKLTNVYEYNVFFCYDTFKPKAFCTSKPPNK